MRFRLAVLDMDGTALDPQNHLTEKTIATINRVIAAGVPVAFGSGRCKAEIRDFVKPFPGMRYAITENGTTVVDLLENKSLSVVPLGREVADAIMELARGRDVLIQLGVGGTYHTQRSCFPRMAEFGIDGYQELFETAAIFEDDEFAFYDANTEPVTKINFYFTSREERAEVAALLEEKHLPVVCVSGLNNNMEMTLDCVSKGTGVTALCTALGIDPSEVLAIGDNFNDLPMLLAVGHSVAMGNAPDAVKAQVKEIAPDNAHDGAAFILEKYFLREEKTL